MNQTLKDLADNFDVTVDELILDHNLDPRSAYIVESEGGELYGFKDENTLKQWIMRMFYKDEMDFYMSIIYRTKDNTIMRIKMKEIELC